MRKNLPLITGIAAFVVFLLVLFACDFGQLVALVAPPPAPTFDPGKTKGNANATVVMIEYSDFQ